MDRAIFKRAVVYSIAVSCLATVVGVLLQVSEVHATMPSGPRFLIQSGPTQTQWMTEEEIQTLSQAAHEAGHCGGFMDITDADEPVSAPSSSLLLIPDMPVPRQQELLHPLLDRLDIWQMYNTVLHLSSYWNRYYKSQSGVEAALWIKDAFQGIAKRRTDITVELFRHSKFAQPSVIARIAGNGPNADEAIVIGGHEDSINRRVPSDQWAEALSPGADDNASGVATVLEVFRVFVESGVRPDRTIYFMTYAGEERGLLGSQDIAKNFRRSGKKVAGVIQFDMTLYPGKNRTIGITTSNTDPHLNHFTKLLLDEYVKAPWKERSCGYACSDHASWNRSGYPAAFPFEVAGEKLNPEWHTPNDSFNETLDLDFGLHFAKLGLAFVVELGLPNPEN